MRVSNSRILNAVRDTMLSRLKPSLQKSDDLALVDSIDVALCELIRRETDGMRLDAEGLETFRALILDAERILSGAGINDSSTPVGDCGNPFDRARLQLAALMSKVESVRGTEASAWIRRALQAETDQVIQQNKPIPHQSVEVFDPLSFNRELLEAEIGRGLGLSEPVKIADASVLSGGFSRSTLAVKWSNSTRTGDVVIRRQKPMSILGRVGVDVLGEFPVLRFVHQHGFAVPDVLWGQADESILGGPFIAMSRVEGKSLGSVMGAQGVTPSMMRTIAVQMARLHRLPWQEDPALTRVFGFGDEPVTVDRSIDLLVERWKALTTDANVPISPVTEAAYTYLERHRPPRTNRLSLIHGDIGFHNLLFSGEKLTAWLDWETCFIGDPAKDIATCRAFVPQYTDWSQFMQWYLEAGGYEVDEQAVDYYSVLRVLSEVAVSELSMNISRKDKSEIEYLVLAGPIRGYFHQDYKSCIDIIASAAA